MINYNEIDSSMIESIKRIYQDEGWISYLNDDEKLISSFNNSLYTLGAFDDSSLIGFIRCVGDGEHILIVQDLIVDLNYRKQGIGTYLFKTIMDRYSQVRMFMVVTDTNNEADNKFYQSFDLKKLEDMKMTAYIR